MPTFTELRDMLQQAVVRDLLGPAGGPDEIVAERNVRGRYLVGLLAPKGQSALPGMGQLLLNGHLTEDLQ